MAVGVLFAIMAFYDYLEIVRDGHDHGQGRSLVGSSHRIEGNVLHID